MPTINVTNLVPGSPSHILTILKEKHKGHTVQGLYRTGGVVVYSVDNMI